MINIITIVLILMPWVVVPLQNCADQMRLPQGLFVCISFMAIIFYGLNSGTKFIYRNKYVSWLMGWIFITYAMTMLLPFFYDVKGVGRALPIWAVESFIYVSLGSFATFLVLSSLDKYDFEKILKTICFSGSIIASVAILQYIGFDIFGKIAQYNCGNRVAACLDNPNVVSNYLCLALPCTFAFFKDKRYWLSIILILLGIVVTKSDLGIVLVGISIISLVLTYFKRFIIYFIGIVALCMGIAAFYAKEILNWAILMTNGRMDAWELAVKHLKDNPVFGQGIGVWKTFNVYIKTTYWTNVHNDWLERAVEIGLLGIVLLLIVVFNTLKKVNIADRIGRSYAIMFVIFLVMMGGSFPFETPTIAFLGLVSFWGAERL